MQKQDLLRRLKCGYVRSVINDVQVRILGTCNFSGGTGRLD
jgi:hypothetical protein